MIKMITDLQNRGHTANLYPYGFHAELPMKDKEMLTKYPIEDRDEKGNLTNRRRIMMQSAMGENWDNEGTDQRCPVKPDYTHWSERTVIVATNAEETGVTFENCMFVVDTCLVNIVYYDPSANVKVQDQECHATGPERVALYGQPRENGTICSFWRCFSFGVLQTSFGLTGGQSL